MSIPRLTAATVKLCNRTQWRARSLWFIGKVALTTSLVLLLLLWGARTIRNEHRLQARALGAESVALQLGAELHEARSDLLTSLPARGLFLELAEGMRQSANQKGLVLAFLYIDLDGFKAVNDRHGHHEGDKVLTRVAEIIRRTTRDGDLLGRLGGDEFVICLSGHSPEVRTVATSVAARIIEDVRDLDLGVGCSIGIALTAGDCGDLPCSLRQADAAMYHAKQMGKGAWYIHEPTQEPCLSCDDRMIT